METIRHNLQQELFKPFDEALYSVVDVTKFGGGKKKKNSFLCAAVTKTKPFQVRIYKVHKSEKETFKKKHCCQLSDLDTVDGKDDQHDTLDFNLGFDKVHHYTASRLVDRNDFIVTLWTLANRYGGGRKPTFVNCQHILDLDPTNKMQSNVKGTSVNDVPGEYLKLTAKEESDINATLSEFEDALTGIEAFTEQLSSELQELEYINITSLMGSEQQAKDLLGLIDRSCDQLNVLDVGLTQYDEILMKVSDQMGQLEFKDNRIEIERENNKQLLEEIKYIIEKLDISQRHVRALQESDLYNPLGIEECISASKVLLDAVNTSFNPGISELYAVKEQIAYLNNLKAQFNQRFYFHLDKFIVQHSNLDIVNYKQVMIITGNDLALPSHDTVHSDFIPYVELIKWLKDLDNENYTRIKTHYEDQFTKTYEKEFQIYMDFARMRAELKVKDSRARKNKVKTSSSQESISSLASVESSSSSSSMFGAYGTSLTCFDQVFDVILSELEPYVSAEQDFCAMFFHLHYPGEDGAEQDSKLPQRKRQHVVDEVQNMMKKIFGFLDLQLQRFISYGENMHPHNILYCMSRIQNQSSHLVTGHTTSTPPTFLGTLFGGWLVYTKRLFDKYIEHLCKQISDTKVKQKKRTGLLADVTTVEMFFKDSEAIFRGSERRAEIDKGYKNIIQVLMVKIEEVAEENDKPPPEIVMFENYHYLHSIIRGLKNQSLENEKKQAEKAYYDAMIQYISSRLGRPLDRMSHFFQGVESCCNSGVRMEDIGYQLAFNQQELKNIIKDYPAKEVKKGLEVLYRKMEKYVTEAGLKQVMWHNLQEAFVRQYERYQELVDLCYPNSNISLLVTMDEILEFFSSIALSN